MAIYIRAIPVLAVIGMRDVIRQIWRSLFQQRGPVLDRKVAVPFVGERSEGVNAVTRLSDDGKLAALDILLHVFEQVVALRSFQGVESFVYGIRDDPPPQGHTARVIDPACMVIRRR